MLRLGLTSTARENRVPSDALGSLGYAFRSRCSVEAWIAATGVLADPFPILEWMLETLRRGQERSNRAPGRAYL